MSQPEQPKEESGEYEEGSRSATPTPEAGGGAAADAAVGGDIEAPSAATGPTTHPKVNGKKSRVHPLPSLGAAAPPPAGAPGGRGRGSVFMGVPEPQAISARRHVPDDDEEDDVDAKVARSAFHRQRTLPSTASTASAAQAGTHNLELLLATFNVLVHLGAMITDFLLMADYNANEQGVSAAAIAIIRILIGLVELEFDYLNRGWGRARRPWFLIPLIFFNCKIFVDYAAYCRSWYRHRHRVWGGGRRDFRANCSFSTLPAASVGLLIVQTYVMIVPGRPIQQVWVVAYAMTILSASLDLLHHFKYVALPNSIYVCQFAKAIISAGLRTILVALLLDKIGRVILAWVVVSYGLGLGVYWYSWRYSRRMQRDNPFAYSPRFHHFCFGGLVAGAQLFVSIPFAPSHSIYDWWIGYLLCEVKQGVENLAMLAVVLDALAGDYTAEVFWSVFALTAVCYIGNLCACYFIHQNVRVYLHARNFYSDTPIVRMFATFLDYYRRAYCPDSILSHGSAQNHLLYKDSAGHVHGYLAQHHDQQVQRTLSLNQQTSAHPFAAPQYSPQPVNNEPMGVGV